jgi:hypothetical protein
MIDRIVHRTDLKKTVAWLLKFFASRSVLPQRPRRRAGESLERFRAASFRSAPRFRRRLGLRGARR